MLFARVQRLIAGEKTITFAYLSWLLAIFRLLYTQTFEYCSYYGRILFRIFIFYVLDPLDSLP